MEEIGSIEIKIDGENISFTTNLSLFELNFWLDHLKLQIVSGELKVAGE